MGQGARSSGIDQRFGELGERYALGAGAVAQLRCLHRLLVDDPLAPTAVRDPTKVIDDHLADSLVALELEPVRTAHALADLGSGAGVPGLPLAIALPAASVVLIDSAARKCEFLERAAAVCGLRNVRVINARVEALPEQMGPFDLVTARALGALDVVAEYAAPLLSRGGTLVVWRGRRDAAAEAAGARAAGELGLAPGEIVRVRPYPAAENRYLHLMSKVTDTPRGFPRRPGMAVKRPLGGR